ncbi:hypothetical protein [Paenibacillus sanfengchensis]|uniref:hypothetical protein n=1 Tax=Paenibacillus sanfengchensis TaxID=3119819 RepID=UPI002FE32551
MIRIISAFISALILSLLFTFITNSNEDNVLYYTFLSKFLFGFVILFLVYLFIAVPLSIYIDQRIKKYGKFTHFLLYCLVGIILGLLFLLFNPTSNNMAGFGLILLFGFAGGSFSIVQNILFLLFSKR